MINNERVESDCEQYRKEKVSGIVPALFMLALVLSVPSLIIFVIGMASNEIDAVGFAWVLSSAVYLLSSFGHWMGDND